MTRRYRILYAPGHPAMQYHIARTGHNFSILANWEQFAYWRPRPDNVKNLFPRFEEAHLDYTPQDYQRLLKDPHNPYGFPGDYDFAWSMWNEQFTLFRPFDGLKRVHRVAKFAELDRADYEHVFKNPDYALASYYQYTVDEIEQAFGVRIPLIELGVSPDDYQGYTGEEKEILSVIHSWKDRGWRYATYHEATQGLPTRHVDHLNPGPEGPLSYPQILSAMRRSRVYWHDGENEYTVALLEAMMTGMPIISARLPFIERHVIHEVNGFVSDDPRQLRDWCQLLLNDHDLARRMGAASRRLALARYHEQRWIDDWNRLFDDFMAGKETHR